MVPKCYGETGFPLARKKVVVLRGERLGGERKGDSLYLVFQKKFIGRKTILANGAPVRRVQAGRQYPLRMKLRSTKGKSGGPVKKKSKAN